MKRMHYSMEVIQFSKVQNNEMLARLLAVGLLLYMLASFGAARLRLNEAQALERELTRRCAQLRAENGGLQAQLAAAGSDEAIEALARERLGLVRPGERVFYFK